MKVPWCRGDIRAVPHAPPRERERGDDVAASAERPEGAGEWRRAVGGGAVQRANRGQTIPGFESSSWQDLFVPANTPREIVMTIQRETVKSLMAADMIERLKPTGRKARRSPRPADALCCRLWRHPTMGRGRLFGRVRGHLRLGRRIPNQTVKSLRGSRNGLLGLSCNRRNKHTDDKADDRKILHRNAPFVGSGKIHRLADMADAAERLCGIAGIAGQYRYPSKTISPTAASSRSL
jgi:Tripartite tricarboxylate transporter family receptor